jgi:hypothetical protein
MNKKQKICLLLGGLSGVIAIVVPGLFSYHSCFLAVGYYLVGILVITGVLFIVFSDRRNSAAKDE